MCWHMFDMYTFCLRLFLLRFFKVHKNLFNVMLFVCLQICVTLCVCALFIFLCSGCDIVPSSIRPRLQREFLLLLQLICNAIQRDLSGGFEKNLWLRCEDFCV